MKLYNKSGRAFIINRADAISGCRFPTEDIGKTRAYIDPGATVEVVDSVGEKLSNDYKKELMRIDQDKATKKPATRKKRAPKA